MNGFRLMADSYRKTAEQGTIKQADAEKKCKALDFLATCDQDDFYNLFDSSAFNDIAKDYLRLAVNELISEGEIDEEHGRAIRNRFSLLFSEKSAKEVSNL